jgi:hypothetical protein
MRLVSVLPLLLAIASCGGKECTIWGKIEVVVPPEQECPSVAKVQADIDAGRHPDHDGEKVTMLTESSSHPAMTLCWYRMDIDLDCPEESRAEVAAGAGPETDVVACDADGWLYGQASPGGAADCPPTIMPKSPVLPFVGADNFPERNVCAYETKATEICADIGTVPGGGLT